MPFFAPVNAFNAGELSPKMIGRSDVDQYSRGCRTLRNFLVTPYGSVERRPGSLFVAQGKSNSNRFRLFRFAFSDTDAYLVEAGPQYMRFFRNGEPLRNGSSIVEISTPYLEAELDDLQFVQCADVMTICHPNHPVQELKRTAVNAFTIAAKSFSYPPMLDPNTDNSFSLTPSAASGSITITASKNLFNANHVGAYFQMVHARKNNKISKNFTADGSSSSIEVFGYWTFITHGTWTGNVTIQRSFDGGSSWIDFRTYSSSNDKNFSENGSEDNDDCRYRIIMEGYSQASSGTIKQCQVRFVNPDFTKTGVVKITAVTDATHAAATVVRKLGGTDATRDWSEGAWSDYRGFPRAVTFFEERMFFGGTAFRPQTIWGSKTAEWDNFLVGEKDDDGIDLTLSSNSVNSILWLAAQQSLIVGTSDSEWTVAASDSGEPLTATNFRMRPQSAYGSAGAPGVIAGDTILFLQRGSRKIREFVYSWEKDGYSSPDLTILAEHISQSGIVEIQLVQQPDTILYCLRGDGRLACLTYERTQEVVGWQLLDTDGSIFSVAAIPDGDSTDIYIGVRRNGRNLVEKFAPRDIPADPAQYVGSDSAVMKTDSSAFSVVSGLDHLEGLSVTILADGALQTPRTVANGEVTLDAPANTAVIGLPFTAILSPMPIDISAQDGSTAMRKKTIAQVRIRFQHSIGGEVRADDGRWIPVVSRAAADDHLDSPITLREDEIVGITPNGGWKESPRLEIRQRDPLPLCVSSINAIVEIGR